MIISEEQARLAAEYAKAGRISGERAVLSHDVPDDLVQRVRDSIDCVPELRADRIAEARALLAHDFPGSSDVARKMLARVVSDSIR